MPVDPVITALLGVTTTTATYNAQRVFPSGEVDFAIVPESDFDCELCPVSGARQRCLSGVPPR